MHCLSRGTVRILPRQVLVEWIRLVNAGGMIPLPFKQSEGVQPNVGQKYSLKSVHYSSR